MDNFENNVIKYCIITHELYSIISDDLNNYQVVIVTGQLTRRLSVIGHRLKQAKLYKIVDVYNKLMLESQNQYF